MEKTLKKIDILTGIASNFLTTLITVIGEPKLYFPPKVDGGNEKIDKNLLFFAILAIVVGTSFGSFLSGIPLTKVSLSVNGIAIFIVFFCWLFFSILGYIFYRLVGGIHSITKVISLFVQTFAVVFVICNFIAFISYRASVIMKLGIDGTASLILLSYLLAQLLLLTYLFGKTVGTVLEIETRMKRIIFVVVNVIAFVGLNWGLYLSTYMAGTFFTVPLS